MSLRHSAVSPTWQARVHKLASAIAPPDHLSDMEPERDVRALLQDARARVWPRRVHKMASAIAPPDHLPDMERATRQR